MPEFDREDRQRHRIALLGVLVICAGYLFVLGPRDWIPHDDGAMGHAAERVLQGEIPHRDFNEPYTGGLTYLHAAAMHFLGVELVVMRWVLFAFSLAFLAAFYRIAARIASPALASIATMVAFAWSLPNYFAPVPSWYNLFFATFGTLALFRFIEMPQRRWLVIAGAMGGLSVLCKIVGLYYFAAVFLVLLFCEQDSVAEAQPAARPSRLFVLTSVLGLLAFAAVVIGLVSSRLTAVSLLLFIVPACSVAAFLGLRAWRLPNHDAGPRLSSLFANIAFVCASAAVVIAAYLAVHFATSSLGDFWQGTVSVVLRRLDYTGAPLPSAVTVLAALPWALVFFWGTSGRAVREPWPVIGLVGLLGVVALFHGGNPQVYRLAWYAVRPLVPIVVVAGCLLLRGTLPEPANRNSGYLLILTAMTSLLGLVQFPFSGGIYFCYVAPMIVLLALYVTRLSSGVPLRSLTVLVGVFSGFALIWLHSGSTYMLGYGYHRVHATTPLDPARGGILVRERDALLYRELTERIQRHTDADAYIYAAPDMPQVYFLSGRRNPTRTFFESTDADYFDPAARDQRIMKQLEAHDVAFAVLGGRSEFARPPSPTIMAFLRERLPNEERVAGYLVRWRSAQLPTSGVR
jgi:hypothetical protein